MSSFSAPTSPAVFQLCVFWHANTITELFFFLLLFSQPSRWTCRKPWLRPLRPAPRSVWYWATPTAAGCPQPWPNSRVLLATAPLPPLPPPPSPLPFPPLASSRAVLGELKPPWGLWMAAILWAGLCPKKMNWTRDSTVPSSTTPWIDFVVRRRTLSRSSRWQASPRRGSKPPLVGAAVLS